MASPIARRLRTNQTHAEKRLWSRLRAKQIDGVRFRRQVPFDKYIVDFYCHSARLVVEIDRGQHAERAEEDAARTRHLEELGFSVIRFWNSDISENLEGVLERIREHLPKI